MILPQIIEIFSMAQLASGALHTKMSLTKRQASPLSTSTNSKRGLAYNAGELLEPFLKPGAKSIWSYNWGQLPDELAPSSLEFVPMLWGPLQNSTWSANAEKAIADGATNFLSFNECDRPDQCNLDPVSAADAHKAFMNPYQDRVRIGTPAISNSDIPGESVDWLSDFLSVCNSSCSYDFCPAHWYGTDKSDFLNYLLSVYRVCGKNIWVTEFAPSGDNEQENITLLLDVMYEMDNNETFSFVERYAYFMVAEGLLLASNTTLSFSGVLYAYW